MIPTQEEEVLSSLEKHHLLTRITDDGYEIAVSATRGESREYIKKFKDKSPDEIKKAKENLFE